MAHHHHAQGLDINKLWEHQKSVFENTRQGLFVYTDEGGTRCNQNLADMLGLNGPDEWLRIPNPLMLLTEDDGSQAKMMISFEDAMNNRNAESFDVTWIKKDREHLKTHVFAMPMAFDGHDIVVYFVALPLM